MSQQSAIDVSARPAGEPSMGGVQRLATGTLVVAYLLAFGKWGSYVHVPGTRVYLTDIALVVSFGWAFWRRRVRVSSFVENWPWIVTPLLLAGWATLVLLGHSQHNITALRDYAPYLYALVCLLALDRPSDAALRRTVNVLLAALCVRLLWVTISVLDQRWVATLPIVGGGARVLALKNDIDVALIGVLAAVAIARAFQSRRAARVGYLLLAVGAWVVAARIGSRGGTLAALVALVAVGLFRLRDHHTVEFRRRLAVTSVIAVCALAVLAAMPTLPPKYGQRSHPSTLSRFISTLTGVKAGTLPTTTTRRPATRGGGTSKNRVVTLPKSATTGAAGTTRARLTAWKLVFRYLKRRPSRLVIGVGFGPDYLKQSGARKYIAGSYEGVRAPHNYLINTLARIGFVGLLTLLAFVCAALYRAWTVVRRGVGALTDLGLMIASALFVASLFGVVLEAPFGAVPFFWAAGQVLFRAKTVNPGHDLQRQSAVPAGSGY